MRDKLEKIIETPWKGFQESKMYMSKPFAFLYLSVLNQVQLGRGFKFYGLPKVYRHKGSTIEIGRRFENRNNWYSNPLGINHPTIFCTWKKGAEIVIGDDVGISGGSIVASEKVEIGKGTLIGANCLIIDTDFHPIKTKKRRYKKKGTKSAPVKIGKNVFVGTGVTILKGATIPDNAVVPAGKVVRK